MDIDHTASDIWSRLRLEGLNKIRVPINGQCMSGFIEDGDIVWIEPVKEDQLRIGDILIVKHGLVLHCHRLIWKSRRKVIIQFVTKGDWSLYRDPPVSIGDIYARVAAIQKTNSIIDLDRQLWRCLCMSTACFILLIDCTVCSILKYIKRTEKKGFLWERTLISLLKPLKFCVIVWERYLVEILKYCDNRKDL